MIDKMQFRGYVYVIRMTLHVCTFNINFIYELSYYLYENYAKSCS